MTLAMVPAPKLEQAGSHATTNVPTFRPEVAAREARATMVGRRYDSAVAIAVCEGEHLLGLVTVEQLFAAPESARLDTLMHTSPPTIGPEADQEVAAWEAARVDESSLAIVDDHGRFRGLVPPRRILNVLRHEHAEDLARLGGFIHDAEAARAASAEPVVRRFWHRIPWLVVGLVGAIAAAGIVGSFEQALRDEVLLVFFVPGIVYMADAVGTQTETLVIRGLSVGVPIGAVVRQELLTGLAVGVVLAAVFLPAAVILWGSTAVAVTVALALLAACSTATIVAMALPWLLHKAGRDPAFGSGPLATVIQDLTSLLIYFTIAAAIVS